MRTTRETRAPLHHTRRSRDPRFDVLFEPIRIGPKVLKNRFYQPPHCMGGGVARPLMQAAFRGMKAEGGWAAVSTEYCSIHPETDDTCRISARLWDDGDVTRLALMTSAVHAHSALAAIELWYGGGTFNANLETRLPSRAPSQLAAPDVFVSVPREMRKPEIREVIGFYADAARRAREAGFDVLHIYAADDQGPMQFLSSQWNRRCDEYGGSLENRTRFLRECLESVRAAVENACAIAVRLSIARTSDAGSVSLPEALEVVSSVDHLVDLWDIKVNELSKWDEDITPSRFYATNAHADYTRAVKEITATPVMGVGRFTDPAVMAAAIEEGQLDIVGGARPSIADPFLPQKIEEGRVHEIRECIGCNICSSRHLQAAPIICTQNATAGEEFRRGWHPEKFARARNADKDVLIVGAGPAGLECAYVLGRREMRRVHLVDAADEPGGSLKDIVRLPGLSEWGRVIAYRQEVLEGMRNVTQILGVSLDADAVRDYGAEIVVLAVGAEWAPDGRSAFHRDGIPGAAAGLPGVLTPHAVMGDVEDIPERLVVYDSEGYFMAASLAEKLARAGREVILTTPFGIIAPYMDLTGEARRQRALLRSLGVSLRTGTHVERVEHGCVKLRDAELDTCEWIEAGIVLVTQRLSRTALCEEIERRWDEFEDAGVEQMFEIGDCVAPRLIADCIFDGHRLGREIDNDNPRVPLPFARE